MPLLTDREIIKLQHDLDEAYKAEIRYEIENGVRQRFIDWGRKSPGAFFVAVYSVANGAYDDLKKDVVRQRITVEQATEILDKMLEYNLINQFLRDCHVNRIMESVSIKAA